MRRFPRLAGAWRVLRGRAIAAPLPVVVGPAVMRPDPTAHFNVYRVLNGVLVTPDPKRYHGNDLQRAANALHAYEIDPAWHGVVYVTKDATVIETIPR